MVTCEILIKVPATVTLKSQLIWGIAEMSLAGYPRKIRCIMQGLRSVRDKTVKMPNQRMRNTKEELLEQG